MTLVIPIIDDPGRDAPQGKAVWAFLAAGNALVGNRLYDLNPSVCCHTGLGLTCVHLDKLFNVLILCLLLTLVWDRMIQ